jgi:hypothetical protein
MSGLPCGPKAALATPGYFAKQRNRRGRQLGRVLATRSHEIVVDRLFDDKTQLVTALLPLVVAAEQTLALKAAQRERTLIRIDAGAGSVSDINWLLFRGYHVLAKDYSTKRAAHLAAQVTDWIGDPQDPARQIGVAPVPADDYHAGPYRRTITRITRIAVRCRLANGQWGIGVVICPLPAADALQLAGLDPALASDPLASALAYVSLYDQRGAAWRPPSRRTNRDWASPSVARSASPPSRSSSRWGRSPTTCWSGPSAGCTTRCPASPSSGSNGWSAISLASVAWWP